VHGSTKGRSLSPESMATPRVNGILYSKVVYIHEQMTPVLQ
jgi:hypothetical protein